jgi:hypothetical protein
MLRPEEAAVVAGVGIRAIYRQVEAGALHFIETEVWPLLICRNSVPKIAARGQPASMLAASSGADKSVR